jgi:hypothetical protein
MKYVVEMGSCTMMYISSFIKNGSVIQKLIHRRTDRQHGHRISLHLFFSSKYGSRLKYSLVINIWNN